MNAVSVALVILMPVVLIGIVVVALLAHRRWVRDQRAKVFAVVAREHGLTASSEGLRGVIGGVGVAATVEQRTHGKSTVTYTVVGSRIHPPLDLGLSVREQHWKAFGGIEAWLYGVQDHVIGDPALDRAFLIGGDELPRIQALLTPAVRAQLLRADKSAGVVLHDGGVQVEGRGEPREAFVTWALDVTVSLGRALEAARLNVPPATSLGSISEGYRAAAASLGLSWMPTPLCLSGVMDGIHVHATTTRVARYRYEALVTAVYPTRLGLDLSMRSTGTLSLVDRVFLGKDAEVGHAAFDEAFRVHTSDEDRLRHVFPVQVLEQLLELRELGPVEVRDDALSVRLTRIPDARHVPQLVDRLAGLARVIHARAVRETALQGPYR